MCHSSAEALQAFLLSPSTILVGLFLENIELREETRMCSKERSLTWLLGSNICMHFLLLLLQFKEQLYKKLPCYFGKKREFILALSQHLGR